MTARTVRRALAMLAELASELRPHEMVAASRFLRRAVRRDVLPSRDALARAAGAACYDRSGGGAT